MQTFLKIVGLDAQGRKEIWEGLQIVAVIGAGFFSFFLLMVNPLMGVICLILTVLFGKIVLFR